MNPETFETLLAPLADALPAGMAFTAYGTGEESDFVRFNHARVRQSGSVVQGTITLRVIDGQRHAAASFGLTGEISIDQQRMARAAAELVESIPFLPEDPHLLLPDTVQNTTQHDDTPAPDALAVTESICTAAEGTDFVGIYAGGRQWRAFANSPGQRNWFEASSSLLDYSLVLSRDRAVKSSLAGAWSEPALIASIDAAKAQLAALERPSCTIEPGKYRAYLAPAAVAEILGLLSWGAFSGQSQQLKVSMLNRMVSGDATLHPSLSLVEDTASGVGPQFTTDGFVKPGQVDLIVNGSLGAALVSPRSALEFGLTHNGSDAHECPAALTMAGGDLDEADALARLGTGVWVSNLWYLNHSDRNAARFTGMTRFATFWVEDGRIVAPLDVMRFDATLFDLLGSDLEALTSQTRHMPSASTYGSRETDFVTVPGALVRSLPLTL